MLLATIPLGWRLTIYLLAGIGAGIANGIAGGGTFITFPTLLRSPGAQALTANVTTHGRRPCRAISAASAAFDFSCAVIVSSCVRSCRPVYWALPRVALAVPARITALFFALVVPWLIGTGTAALRPGAADHQAPGARHADHAHPARRWGLFIGVFVVAIYGGYFRRRYGDTPVGGDGRQPALRDPRTSKAIACSVLSLIINVIAALIFVARGHLIVDAVYMFLIGTLVGGWLGAMLILRLSPNVVRVVIIVVGLVTTIRLAIVA